jgi:2,3,4,5-tetrahydropyridine-2,6-dicarboxylate N-succinyltransferase
MTLQQTIDAAFENRAELNAKSAPADVKAAVAEVLQALDSGKLRVAEKQGGEWITHQWVKKAVLLSFRLRDNEIMQGGFTHYFDKVDSKFARYSQADFAAGGYRVVPPAVARHGAFLAKNVVLMPSYVNVGAYVDEGKARWSTRGPPSARARRSARTCTSPGVSASAACSSRCRPTRRSSRTTASSARAAKWSKA